MMTVQSNLATFEAIGFEPRESLELFSLHNDFDVSVESTLEITRTLEAYPGQQSEVSFRVEVGDFVMNSETKFSGLKAIKIDLDEAIRQVALQDPRSGLPAGWGGHHYRDVAQEAWLVAAEITAEKGWIFRRSESDYPVLFWLVGQSAESIEV